MRMKEHGADEEHQRFSERMDAVSVMSEPSRPAVLEQHKRDSFSDSGAEGSGHNTPTRGRTITEGLLRYVQDSSVARPPQRYSNVENPAAHPSLQNQTGVGYKDHYYRGVASSSSLRDYLGRRMQVERIGDYGSVLIIRDWDQRDTGIYRCFATRSYDSGYNYRAGYGRKEAIYMEVDFLPRARTSGSRRGYSDYFSSNRDYYYRDRPYNSRDYGWYRSGVKSEGDTIVIDAKAVKTEKDTKTKE